MQGLEFRWGTVGQPQFILPPLDGAQYNLIGRRSNDSDDPLDTDLDDRVTHNGGAGVARPPVLE